MGWRCGSVVFLLAAMLLPFMASSGSIVKNLPGYHGDLPFNLETGYIGVGEGANVQIFYYFVESQRNPFIDPILLWFVGGPGCSGLSAFFFENGPLVMVHNYSGNLPKLELNPYSWTHMLNMIYIDMPVGTGFSYSETQEDYYTSDNGKPTGPLVQKVYEGYKARHVPHINIKGYVLASPVTDMYMHNDMEVLYAYHMTLIPEELYESLKQNCQGNYANIDPENTKCVSDYEAYSEMSYGRILLDIWANDENVRKALHVRKGTKEEFLRCNTTTLAYTKDGVNAVENYQNLTNANLEALIYCSDLDMLVPHMATQYWIKSLNLSTHDKWRAWFVEGQVAGYTEIYKTKEDHYLTYVTVKGAGHVAQKFKPKEVYEMIKRWFSFSLI